MYKTESPRVSHRDTIEWAEMIIRGINKAAEDSFSLPGEKRLSRETRGYKVGSLYSFTRRNKRRCDVRFQDSGESLDIYGGICAMHRHNDLIEQFPSAHLLPKRGTMGICVFFLRIMLRGKIFILIMMSRIFALPYCLPRYSSRFVRYYLRWHSIAR